MKDYAYKDRQRAIGGNLTPRQNASRLHDMGIDWHDACSMAGYDELEEMERSMRRWLLGAAAAIALILVIVSSAAL